MKEQNYKNHRQVVYGYYLFTGIPIVILIIVSVKRLVADRGQNMELNLLLLLIGWILLTMLFRSRKFALIAQDRAIRAEENLRYFFLTNERLDPRLSIRQITALRFAGDEELPLLVKQTIEENLTNDEIKKRIKNWRSDWTRV